MGRVQEGMYGDANWSNTHRQWRHRPGNHGHHPLVSKTGTLGFMKIFSGYVSILLHHVSPDNNIPSGRLVRPAREVPDEEKACGSSALRWGGHDQKNLQPALKGEVAPHLRSAVEAAPVVWAFVWRTHTFPITDSCLGLQPFAQKL